MNQHVVNFQMATEWPIQWATARLGEAPVFRAGAVAPTRAIKEPGPTLTFIHEPRKVLSTEVPNGRLRRNAIDVSYRKTHQLTNQNDLPHQAAAASAR